MLSDSRLKRYKEKLEKLIEYESLLGKWLKNNNLKEIQNQNNIERIFAIYHSIQLIVEVITDISSMILKDSSIIVEDNYTNFKNLLKRSIISNELYNGLKNLNGLRNRIVHDYNGIADEIVWSAIEENKKYINKFKGIVNKWLEKQNR